MVLLQLNSAGTELRQLCFLLVIEMGLEGQPISDVICIGTTGKT